MTMMTKILSALVASCQQCVQGIINATWVDWLVMSIGGLIGWVVGEFDKAVPLLTIATLFVLYDAWSAYELDKRVHLRYPDKVMRTEAKFVSYKFRTVIPTLIERYVIIILAYCVQRWVFVDFYVPLSYIAAGVVCAEQALSIAENKSSCRLPGDKHGRLWKMLAKVLIDKTERHFDIDLGKEAHKKESTDHQPQAANDSDIIADRADIEPIDSSDM